MHDEAQTLRVMHMIHKLYVELHISYLKNGCSNTPKPKPDLLVVAIRVLKINLGCHPGVDSGFFFVGEGALEKMTSLAGYHTTN